MSRLPDPTAALWREDREAWERIKARRVARGGHLPGVYLPLMYNAGLAEQAEAFGGYLRYEGVLPRDIYEFTVLAVGKRIGSVYQWTHHEPHAVQAGVPDDVIAALSAGETPREPYGTVLGAVAAFLSREVLDAGLQDRLSSIVGTDGVVEMALLVGWYAALGGVINAFEVVPEDDQAVS